jgi:ribonuclease BN (tRNA processing enzyme)
MELHVIGSGDAFGNGGRYQTCFALRDDERIILIDCGATSLTAMKDAGLDPLDVHAVVVSHLHGDHFGGIPFMVLDAQFRRRTEPFVVYGPPGTKARLADAMETLYPGSTSVSRRFDLLVTELDPDGTPTRADGLTVRGVQVDHACGAPPLAVRVETPTAAVAYSGDTAWTPALFDVSRDADLFLVECYTWDRDVKYHLSHRQVADNLDAFAAKAVMLTHMSPDMLAHTAEACAPTATDNSKHALP